jgi:flagellar hook-basal body complex protein FliE
VPDPVGPIGAAVIRPIAPVGGPGRPTGPGFAETLKQAVADVTRAQQEAETAARAFATGQTTDVAATMIAVERANVTFQLMLQIRNRLLEAYQEIQRVQV